MAAQKRQKTISQTFQQATNSTTIFTKHDIQTPKGDDAKGFLDRFRRDVLEDHRRANQTPSQPMFDAEDDDEDMDDSDEPATTTQQVEGAGLRYTAILRTRLITGSMLSPYAADVRHACMHTSTHYPREQINGLYEVLLLAAMSDMPLVATEASRYYAALLSKAPHAAAHPPSVLLHYMRQVPLTTCVPPEGDALPFLCEYRGYWDPVLAYVTHWAVVGCC